MNLPETPEARVIEVPLVVKILASLLLIAEIIYLTLGGLATLVQIFSASLAVGLVLVLVGGFGFGLAFAGVWVAIMGFGLLESFDHINNPFEYWVKMISSYAGIVVGAYLAFILGNLILIVVASWLSRFIN